MTGLKHKLIALFSLLVIVAAAITVAGCKPKSDDRPTRQPTKEPMEEL